MKLFYTTILFGILAAQGLWAQSKLTPLRADKNVEDLVEAEVNKYRLIQMGRQWWQMPTSREEGRILDARYSRYFYDSLFYVGKSKLDRGGAFYKEQEDLLNNQNLTVLGWHPYWEHEAYQHYNFKLLTHLAFYAYEVNPLTGGYENFEAIYKFKNSDLIEKAHWDTCQVLLTVACHGLEDNDIFFDAGYPFAQQNLIDSLANILEETGADGVNLSFEEIPEAHKDKFLAFIRDLSYNLRESNNNYTISLNLPLEDEHGIFEMGKLKPWVDIFVIQGFNFHIGKTKLRQAPLSPLYSQRSETKGTYLIYNKTTNLKDLLTVGSQYHISTIHLLHSPDYVTELIDSLDVILQASRLDLEALKYDRFNVANTLSIISANETLLADPIVTRLLQKTNCDADIVRDYPADEKVNFFLFQPNWDTLYIKEKEFFVGNMSIVSGLDTTYTDIRSVVDKYTNEIGSQHKGSLVLGLPYYGAVWWDEPSEEGDERFEGYMTYNQIRQIVNTGNVCLSYDKARHSMIAMVMDTIVLNDTVQVSDTRFLVYSDTMLPNYKIYFDNSTSLSEKFDFALEQGMGGVALWALGYDHGYSELWATLEESFAQRWVWNVERQQFEKYKVDKSNKIAYTIQYNVKRNSNVILATLFIIAIFMAFGFSISLLDWKVRDALFYSGSFRLFYLTLFTVLVLMFGSYVGLFRNWMATLIVGLLLGVALTWVATALVRRQQDKLP